MAINNTQRCDKLRTLLQPKAALTRLMTPPKRMSWNHCHRPIDRSTPEKTKDALRAELHDAVLNTRCR
jgi:hypothetical protein